MPPIHYVNNQELLVALVAHRKLVKQHKREQLPPPQISEYIGLCFLKIAEHLSRKPNFASYTFREDMISDAVENCIQCIRNFNPAKSKNPFSYFTQIIYFAFLRRIGKEKKQLYMKYKATEQLGLLQDSGEYNLEELGLGNGKHFQIYENISDFIQTFEASRQQTFEKSRKKKLRSSKCAQGDILKFVGDL